MQKCTTCQYYDRKSARAATGNLASSQQGQCRRMAPMLNPVNTKSYLIEGVWPTVHDDDWCGEWKLVARRTDVRANELAPGKPASALQPMVPHVARIGANIGAEPIGGAHLGTVLSAAVKPFLPPAPSPAAGAAAVPPIAPSAVGALSAAD